MDLSSKALLIQLSISCLSSNKLDKQETASLADRKNVTRADVRVTKVLYPPEALEAIKQAGTAIRTFVASQSLPWSDTGSARILPAVKFLEFQNKFQELKTKHDDLVDDFVGQYESHVEAARRRLNGLFNESDYLVIEDVRRKFSVKLDYLPLPNADDFRLELGQDEVQALQAQYERMIETSLESAMGDLSTQLSDAVTYIHKITAEDGVRFRGAAIEKISEAVQGMDALNLTQNARISKIIKDFAELLETVDASTIRESPLDRVRIHDATKNLMGLVDQL